jgi:hypothetical protein
MPIRSAQQIHCGLRPALERLITQAMDEWKIPGLAVAVVQNGEAPLARAYGLRDVEAGSSVTTDTQPMGRRRPDSIFESGSTMMYLAEKAVRFWPQDPRNKYEVTQWVGWQLVNQGPPSLASKAISDAPPRVETTAIFPTPFAALT